MRQVPSGTRMLEELKKKGKPISPKMQQMADWLDSLEAGQEGGGQPGEVCAPRSHVFDHAPAVTVV